MLSLAFGIGVNTAILTLVNGILLKKPPIPEADRVVQLQAHLEPFTSSGFSYLQFAELRRQTAIFSDAAAFGSTRVVLDASGDSQHADLQLVNGNYFSFFHAEPALGRLLNEEDDRLEGAHAVCVLSYAAWRSRFASDPHVLGRIVHVNTHPFEIIGVAGPDFVGAELQNRYDLWVPTAMAGQLTRNARSDAHVVCSGARQVAAGMSPVEAR